jgi:DNA-binding response OmpR family regulator
MNNRTILLIEDDASLLETILEILVLEGFKVITAPDGQHGLKIAAEQRPELIVSDLMMPRMNGYEMLSALRKSPQTAKIPVILITAYSDYKQIPIIEQDLGADVIIKPFNPADLLATIERRLHVEVS